MYLFGFSSNNSFAFLLAYVERESFAGAFNASSGPPGLFGNSPKVLKPNWPHSKVAVKAQEPTCGI